MAERIYLSPPHLSGLEQVFVQQAFDSNWIAPLGPQVDAFEGEFAGWVGTRAALALASGTAALHLALLLVGVGAEDEVMVSTLTFAGSVYPICYLGARPVFVDSESNSWNMNAALLADALAARARQNRLPKAVVLVHLYGQCADLDTIAGLCAHYGVALVEDAAEALGATYRGRSPGGTGRVGCFSFNGNKIITTSGGGMLVSDEPALVAQARKLASQAREPAPYYEHQQIGYNYRMSNVLAAIGRGQLAVLGERVAARRCIFAQYQTRLGDLPGLTWMPEAPWGTHSRWLTTLTVDPAQFGADAETIRLALEAENIEARPVWKPMHLQPVFAGYPAIGGEVAEDLFRRGLCLPSGSSLDKMSLERVVSVIRDVHGRVLSGRA